MRQLIEELREKQVNLRRAASRKAQSSKAAELPAEEAYRVAVVDVLAYKRTMQVNRRAALDELVKASEDAGGYDLDGPVRSLRGRVGRVHVIQSPTW